MKLINSHKSLLEIHEDVPANHYDRGIKYNLFQKFWHYRRFNEIIKFVTETNGPILDIGCHGGTFTQKIVKKTGTKKIYGIDISSSAINLISKKIPFGNFKVADAAKIPFKNDFFDQVFCLEMLEHVDYPELVVKEIKRVLKNGGFGVILIPSENKLFKIVWFLWTLYYPMWRHAHVQNFSDSTLENYLKKLGFKILKIKYFNLKMLKIIYFKK